MVIIQQIKNVKCVYLSFVCMHEEPHFGVSRPTIPENILFIYVPMGF